MRSLAISSATLLLLSACGSLSYEQPTVNENLSSPAADNLNDGDTPEFTIEAEFKPAEELKSREQLTDKDQGADSKKSSKVEIALVAIGDEGESGKEFGCGDSIVFIETDPLPGKSELESAITKLLDLKEINEPDLMSVYANSFLSLESASIDESGVANINLNGQVVLAGLCDDPRAEAQIHETALRVEGVKKAVISLNGSKKEWDSLFNMKGI